MSPAAMVGLMRDTSLTDKPLALTREKAAEALSISPSTVDRLTQRGLLKPCRGCRRPLYSIEEIERFLKEEGQS